MSIPKISGIEQEYAIAFSDGRNFDPIQISFLLVNSVRREVQAVWDYGLESPFLDARGFSLQEEQEIRLSHRDNFRINNLLANGARYYVDHAHPEFSTAECLSVSDVVAFDRAGERYLETAAKVASAQLTDPGRICVFKNNTDHKGNSYGTHENYLVDALTYDRIFPAYPRPTRLIDALLIPYFVSRQIITGAGKVGGENGTPNIDFQLSQRADFFETLVGANTTSRRPIVNSRDEPHADRKRFRRLHCIVGDANMSTYANFLKIGMTQLVLRMVEDGFIDFDLTLEHPIRELRDVSTDLTFAHRLHLAKGSPMTALEIQRRFCEAAASFVNMYPQSLDPHAQQVVDEWQKTLDQLDRDPLSTHDRLDWAIKYWLLDRFRNKKNLAWDSAQIRRMDIHYHDVCQQKGLFYILEKEGKITPLPFEKNQVQFFTTEPPEDTRAFFRAKCLQRFPDRIIEANWDSLTLRSESTGAAKKIRLNDPTKGTRKLTGRLIAACPDVDALLEALQIT